MKTSLHLLGLLLLTVLSAAAGAPWVSQTGLTDTQLSDRIAHWSAPPAPLAPACISGYVESGQTRYACLWVKPIDRWKPCPRFKPRNSSTKHGCGWAVQRTAAPQRRRKTAATFSAPPRNPCAASWWTAPAPAPATSAAV